MKTAIKIGDRTKLFSEGVAYFEANINYTIIHYYQGQDKKTSIYFTAQSTYFNL